MPVLFWSFRFMVGARLLVHRAVRRRLLSLGAAHARPLPACLWAALLSLPLPWIAAELGWIVAEYGRQPWAIEGVLPTVLGVSCTDASNVLFSLIGFVVFYSALLVVDVFLLHEIHPARARRDAMGAASSATEETA